MSDKDSLFVIQGGEVPSPPFTWDFDCGQYDLNEFFLEDALLYSKARLTNTIGIKSKEGFPIAYISLCNDSIRYRTLPENHISKRGFKRKIAVPDEKWMSSFPAVKIARFAVSKDYQGMGYGSRLFKYTLGLLNNKRIYTISQFRFLTVDAKVETRAYSFYEKFYFDYFCKKEDVTQYIETHVTIPMFFDMKKLDED